MSALRLVKSLATNNLGLIVLYLLLSISGFASEHKPEFAQQLADFNCPSDAAEFQSILRRLKPKANEWIKSLTAETCAAKLLDSKDRDITWVSFFWPDMMKLVNPSYRLYERCSKLQKDFLNDRAADSLDRWQNCVEHNYGQAGTPELYNVLSKCYKRWVTRPRS